MSLLLDHQPRLSQAARLRFDEHSHSYVLLSPERGLRLNDSAAEIVQRCTGQLTVRQIVQSLQQLAPAVSRDSLADDVVNLLLALHQRRLVVFDPSS
jgi:pyrroloquinoline quinone biosynthesis protein D